MKLLILTLLSLGAIALPAVAASEKEADSKKAAEEKKEQGASKAVDARTKKEIQAMEDRLRAAFEKCNEGDLDQLLADYFADSVEGREQATNKAGMIARCKAGKLFFLALGEEKELSRSAEVVTIRGVAAAPENKIQTDDVERPKAFRVRRLWAKKSGKWLLILQERAPVEEEEREKSREQSK
jgi:hypothetical protein